MQIQEDIKEKLKGRFSDGIYLADLHVVDLLNTSEAIYEENSNDEPVAIISENSPHKSPKK